MPEEALVDPAVSLSKFENEVARYQQNQDDYIGRGWWMVKAKFPQVFMVFGTPSLKPAIAPFGAIVDFTNYDFWPPSVQLADPFSFKPYSREELPIPSMPRLKALPVQEGIEPSYQVENLLQAESANAVPFICVPGIREYHRHPAHSGDSWFVHRKRGEGTLDFVLNLLGTYALGAVRGFHFDLRLKIQSYQNHLEIPQ